MKKVTRKVKVVTWMMGYIDSESGRTSENVITVCDGTDMTKQVGKVTADRGMCYSATVDSETEVLMAMDINDFVRYAMPDPEKTDNDYVRYATPVEEKTEEEEEDNE